MAADIFTVTKRDGPLVVSMPHVGTKLSPSVMSRMTDEARNVPDTDWLVDQLYDFLADMNATVIQATYSRYIVDLNRGIQGNALYSGQSETTVCPITTFHDQDIYLPGQQPSPDEIQDRMETYWHPYHRALQEQLEEIKSRHGYALLWDAHSIATIVPRFFEGELPDLNIGTGGGTTCDEKLSHQIYDIGQASEFQTVLNGRFKGGYITRHYGQPDQDIHAIQMEIALIAYMDEGESAVFSDEKAARLRPVLEKMIQQYQDYFR